MVLDVLMAANINFMFLFDAGDAARRAQLVDLVLDGALHGGAVPRHISLGVDSARQESRLPLRPQRCGLHNSSHDK